MSEVSVSGFRVRVRGPRSDKGKKHNYPETRRAPLNSSLTVKDLNLALNAKQGRIIVMSRKYKGTPSMREYWREKKREQREKENLKGRRTGKRC